MTLRTYKRYIQSDDTNVDIYVSLPKICFSDRRSYLQHKTTTVFCESLRGLFGKNLKFENETFPFFTVQKSYDRLFQFR